MNARLFFLACGGFLGTSLSAAQEPPSYAKHIRPFFVKYCAECHNAKVDKRGLNLDSYKTLLEGSDLGPVVVAAKPGQSKLIQMIEGKDKTVMPPKTAKRFPAKEEIAQVRAWVQAGAKDDSGLIKVAIPDIKPHRKRPAPVTAVQYSQEGLELFWGQGNEWGFLNPRKGKILDIFPIPENITAMAFTWEPYWPTLATRKPGEVAKLHFIYRREIERSHFLDCKSLNTTHSDSILDMAFQPKGDLLATASYDTTVKIWRKFKEIRTLKEHSDAVYGVSFSPDGTLLASGGADRAVKVWEVASGKLLYTLGESTDWVYTVSFSPDGKHLAAAGVDKSIRVWEVTATSHKLVHSVFAHEAPVIRLVYGKDGKTLYSLGEDRIVKAWDAARMVERKVYDRQPETVLALAVSPDQKQIALGRYDGVVVLLDEATGKVQHEIKPGPAKGPPPKKPAGDPSLQKEVRGTPHQGADARRSPQERAPRLPQKDPLAEVKEKEPNDSPGTGQKISLPATVVGTLDRAGDVDFYRFEAREGQELGVHLVIPEKSKLEPFLQLVDDSGEVVLQSSDGFLGYRFRIAGTYAIGVRDRELRGGPGMTYRLRLGDIPVMTFIYPMGLERGKEREIVLGGVNLKTRFVRVKAPVDAAIGSKIALPLKENPLGLRSVLVGEFPEVYTRRHPVYSAQGHAGDIPVPGTGNGYLLIGGQTDLWKFKAKKGQRLVVEVNARRLGSNLDSIIEILDDKNRPVPRATLRSLAKTYVTFRDHDSAGSNIRIEAWGELAVNDYLYVGSELLKIKSLPTHPDADCIFFSDRGQRIGFLDTTPTHQSLGMPMYKVAIHPPGTKFAPNGFPVITLYYRNDDGGPGYGRDSRLFFDPPADGEYRVRISDAPGQARWDWTFGYRLTVRPPRPSFNVTFNPTSPAVYKGGAIPVTASAERIDGYDGEIALKLENLPPGFSAPLTTIPPGENSTTFALFAEAGAKTPAKGANLKLTAHAVIEGKKIVKEVPGGLPKLIDPGDIVTTTVESAVALKPGGTVKMTVNIERRNNFTGRVPVDVRGLPHGVKVLDIGLNGILITERETRRVIVLYAEPWVEPTEHPIVVLARREGKNTEHAAKSVLLRVIR